MRFIEDALGILMTDTSLPKLWTFTVRFFFYGDCHAGTWQNGPHGGHEAGHIENRATRPEGGPPRNQRAIRAVSAGGVVTFARELDPPGAPASNLA